MLDKFIKSNNLTRSKAESCVYNGIINSRHPDFYARTNNIDIRTHFIREKMLSGEVELIERNEYPLVDWQDLDVRATNFAF